MERAVVIAMTPQQQKIVDNALWQARGDWYREIRSAREKTVVDEAYVRYCQQKADEILEVLRLGLFETE